MKYKGVAELEFKDCTLGLGVDGGGVGGVDREVGRWGGEQEERLGGWVSKGIKPESQWEERWLGERGSCSILYNSFLNLAEELVKKFKLQSIPRRHLTNFLEQSP